MQKRQVWRVILYICFLNFTPINAFAKEISTIYQSIKPLSLAPPGSLVRFEKLYNSAALPSAAENFLMLYHSRSLAGKDILLTGTVAIPRGKAPKGGWPVTTWMHGTTGISAACAPSRDTKQGPEHYFLAMKQALMDTYVKQGYVVLATDYEGLGPLDAMHPFLQGKSEARGGLDIIRAARQINPHISKRYLVIGHSQGGQADLFAAAIAPKYAPELSLLGNVAMAPASHIDATILNMAKAIHPSYQLTYAMYVLLSFASNHADIDLGKILTPLALAHLQEIKQQCITATVSAGYWADAIPKDQFIPGANLAAVLKIAKDNDPGNLHINTPTLIVQGSADETVLPEWTDAVVNKLCKNGNKVAYTVYQGATHETIPALANADVNHWVQARFSRKAARNDCKK